MLILSACSQHWRQTPSTTTTRCPTFRNEQCMRRPVSTLKKWTRQTKRTQRQSAQSATATTLNTSTKHTTTTQTLKKQNPARQSPLLTVQTSQSPMIASRNPLPTSAFSWKPSSQRTDRPDHYYPSTEQNRKPTPRQKLIPNFHPDWQFHNRAFHLPEDKFGDYDKTAGYHFGMSWLLLVVLAGLTALLIISLVIPVLAVLILIAMLIVAAYGAHHAWQVIIDPAADFGLKFLALIPLAIHGVIAGIVFLILAIISALQE